MSLGVTTNLPVSLPKGESAAKRFDTGDSFSGAVSQRKARAIKILGNTGSIPVGSTISHSGASDAQRGNAVLLRPLNGFMVPVLVRIPAARLIARGRKISGGSVKCAGIDAGTFVKSPENEHGGNMSRTCLASLQATRPLSPSVGLHTPTTQKRAVSALPGLCAGAKGLRNQPNCFDTSVGREIEARSSHLSSAGILRDGIAEEPITHSRLALLRTWLLVSGSGSTPLPAPISGYSVPVLRRNPQSHGVINQAAHASKSPDVRRDLKLTPDRARVATAMQCPSFVATQNIHRIVAPEFAPC